MVGTDIIEVTRIEKLIKEKGDKFLNKIYTQKEIDYCESKGPNKYQHYAGQFAAKEATFKAISNCYLARGFDNSFFNWLTLKKIVINNHYINDAGRTFPVTIMDEAFPEEGTAYTIYISISHVKTYATAISMIQVRDRNN